VEEEELDDEGLKSERAVKSEDGAGAVEN